MPKDTVLVQRFDGVCLSRHPRELKDTQLVRALNTYPAEKGAAVLSMRPHTQLIDSEVFATWKQTLITGEVIPDPAHPDLYARMAFAQFEDTKGHHHLLLWLPRYTVTPGPIYNTGGVLLEWDSSTSSWHVVLGKVGTDDYGLSAIDRPCFVNYQRKLYVFTGADKSGYILYAPLTGSSPLVTTNTYDDVGFNWHKAIKPKVVSVYRGSFMLADFDPEQPGYVALCDPLDPLTLIPEASWFFVGVADDQRIVATKEIAVVGGSDMVEPYWLVLKQRSMWMVQGEPPTSVLNGTLRVTPINKDEGCISKETVVDTPHGTVWCSGKNVWLMPSGQQPVKVGDDIAPLLASHYGAAVYAWHAVYKDGFYKLTIPRVAPGQGDTGEDYGEAYLTAPTEQWWLDMREYPERMTWWGPMDLPAAAAMVETFSDGHSREVQAFVRLSEPNSTLYFVEANQRTEAHLDAHSGLDNQTGPKQELVFKEFTFGDPVLKKIVSNVELVAYVENPNGALDGDGNFRPADDFGGVALKMLGDSGRLSVAGEQATDGSLIPSSDFTLDLTELDSDSGVNEEFAVAAVYPANGDRFVARTFQPVLYTEPSETNAPAVRLAGFGMKIRPIGRRIS
jgi:hypothetical protein